MARLSQKLLPVTVNVPILTEWQSYTPTVTGLGTGTLSYVLSGSHPITRFLWRRVGDSCEIYFRLTTATAGSGTDPVSISMPDGVVEDYAKMTGSTQDFGRAELIGASSASSSWQIISGVSGLRFFDAEGTWTALTGAGLINGGTLWGRAIFPVVGWATHGPVSTVAYALTANGNSLGTPVTVGAVDGQTTTVGGSGGTTVMGRLTAATTGQVGEVLTGTGVTNSNITAGTYYTAATVPLTPGVWHVTGKAYFQAPTGTDKVADAVVGLLDSAGSPDVSALGFERKTDSAGGAGGAYVVVSVSKVYAVASATTIYLRAQAVSKTGTINLPSGNQALAATRIA